MMAVAVASRENRRPTVRDPLPDEASIAKLELSALPML